MALKREELHDQIAKSFRRLERRKITSYLRTLETSGNERKNNKRVSHTNEKLLKTKLQLKAHPRDKYLCSSSCKVLGPFSKWTSEELRQMDKRIKMLTTMHKALHPIYNIDRLYVPRKVGGRGLTSIEDCIDTLILGLEN